jgi:transposase, IS5 family
MRLRRTIKASSFDVFSAHQNGRELKAMSVRLDRPGDDLGMVGIDDGRHGLPAESVLRCALLKQYRQLSNCTQYLRTAEKAPIRLNAGSLDSR